MLPQDKASQECYNKCGGGKKEKRCQIRQILNQLSENTWTCDTARKSSAYQSRPAFLFFANDNEPEMKTPLRLRIFGWRLGVGCPRSHVKRN
ncbi:hypothetical protein AD951_02075 [Acetobacter malorum]|uniref:Uncharacterized protein n=1 Tax=Acetobacter malorum TaxID=178901 RepID=A0A149USZ6_9PROT|nr:hypothetical protein AD951_02075 [Acetobacter malorum]